MGSSPKELGLAPNLSRLPSWVRSLIRHGDRGEHPNRSEASVAICAEMFRVGYGLDEVWMVMTNPANGISQVFFQNDGEEAEVNLERIISRAHETVTLREGNE